MNALSTFLCNVSAHIIQPLVALIVAAGVAYFIWTVATFMWDGDKAEKRKKGTEAILWGVAGLFIMVAVGTILQIALNTFGINANGPQC